MDTIVRTFQTIDSKDQISLVLSCISILISLFAGTWNFLYTRRQFRAAQYPLLNSYLRTNECDSGTCLRLHLKNMSRDKSVVNAEITLFLRNPTRVFWFNRPRWIKVVSTNDANIGPGEEFILLDHAEREFNSLEQFLVHHFPSYLEAERVGKKNFIYYLSHHSPLNFQVVIKYLPGFSGAKQVSDHENIKIIPIYSTTSNQRYRLNFWKVK